MTALLIIAGLVAWLAVATVVGLIVGRRMTSQSTGPGAPEANLPERIVALANDYEAAGYGDPRPSGRPAPVWLGEVAVEIRGLVDGSTL